MSSRKGRKEYFVNLLYLVLGLLTGIIGNMWTYYFSKWIELNLPGIDWNFTFYSFTVILVIWLALLIRYIHNGMREFVPRSKKKKN